MSYTKHNFQAGGTILAAPFNAMEDQIAANETAIAGKYEKPSGGIPKTDLASAVQTSLGKADSALQAVPDTYRTSDAQDEIDGGKASASDLTTLEGRVTTLESGSSELSSELKAALLQLANKVAYIDAGGQTYYQDLYNALYAASGLSSITAVYNPGNNTVTVNDTLNDLKQYLTVTAHFSDSSASVISASSYVLSGSMNQGTNTITVSYGGKSTTFTVTVSPAGEVTLSSISASLNLGNDTIYTCNALDDLRPYLTVTGAYSNSSAGTIDAYLCDLSGNMAAGTNTVTVSYEGKTATVSVAVTSGIQPPLATLPSGYTQLTYIKGSRDAYTVLDVLPNQVSHAKYGVNIESLSKGEKIHFLAGSKSYYTKFVQNNSDETKNINAKNCGNETFTTAASTQIPYEWALNTDYILEGLDSVCVNGVCLDSLSPGNETTDNTYLHVFGMQGSATVANKPKAKLYFMRLYDTTHHLLRNLIPCKNSSDVAGLYDTVTGTFYSSQFSTDFTAGSVRS